MKTHTQSLDGLKALSILAIVYYHFNADSIKYYGSEYPFYGNPLVSLVTEYGLLFTEILFMLSGFFICAGYREKIISRSVDFKTFMQKRFKKIYPLYVVTLVTQFILEMLIFQIQGTTIYSSENYNFYSLILNVLLIQSGWIGLNMSINGVTWYLSVLLFCYVLYYFTAKYVKGSFRFIIVNTIYVFAGLSVMVEGLLHVFFNIYLFRGIACFSIGILLYYLNLMLSDVYKKRIVMIGVGISLFVLFLVLCGGKIRTILGGGKVQIRIFISK